MKIETGLFLLLLNFIVDPEAFAQDIPLVYNVENSGAKCPTVKMPSFSELPSIDPLPDPFKWSERSGRISGIIDWSCRRAEISAKIQHYEMGTKPDAPGVPWYSTSLKQFDKAVTKLPFDHHELMAMMAPRALFVLGNPDNEWLADESGYVSCMAAKEVWKAFSVPERFGFSIVARHGHCQLPDSQEPEVIAFVEKFLLGNMNANTSISTVPYNTDISPWISWWGKGEPPVLQVSPKQ